MNEAKRTCFKLQNPSYTARTESKVFTNDNNDDVPSTKKKIKKKCHVLDSTQQKKKHNALREREIPVTVSRTWRAITRSPGSATLTRAQVSNSRLLGSNLTPTNTFRPPSPSPINFIGRIIQCFLFSLSCVVAFILGIAR